MLIQAIEVRLLSHLTLSTGKKRMRLLPLEPGAPKIALDSIEDTKIAQCTHFVLNIFGQDIAILFISQQFTGMCLL